jgi:ERI1 exoribonuclease 2
MVEGPNFKKEIMQAIGEASIGCLRPNGPLQFSCQDKPGSTIEALHLPNNDKKMENQINTGYPEKLIQDSIPPPNHGYNRPYYYQDFFPPYILPDCQVGHYIYQPGQDYYFPFDNRVQYLPHKVFSQGVPPLDPNFQEFQYFVVIDFEATCDKDRNPHPQEIIEFPSVLVNSATGQLEASFQTYVRPTYHQHLTEFCKELTGIQQIQVGYAVTM